MKNVAAKKNPVSPASSGGAGTHFEYRVAAIAYSYLLTGTHAPGLVVPVTAVGLQQRVHGHLLDDIVLTAEPGPEPLCTEYQAKLTLTGTAGDRPFLDVLIQGLHQLHDRRDEVARGDLALGIAARGDVVALAEIAELAELARGHTSHRTFVAMFVAPVVRQALRDRWDQIRQAFEKVISQGAPDLGGVECSAHAFISALHVWCVADGDDGADYRDALDRLGPTAASFQMSPADLFGHLAALAQGWGVVAGVVDAESVRRNLRRRGVGLRLTGADVPVIGSDEIDADAVVRGPIAALELDAVLDDAERLASVADPSAPQLFAQIAEQLETHGMRPHAAIMRRREADARQNIGAPDDALIDRVGIAWDYLDQVQVWEARFALNDGQLPGHAVQVGDLANRVRAVAQAAAGVATSGDLDRMITAFDALREGGPHHERAAAFLCEEAIAAGLPETVSERAESLTRVATTASRHGNSTTRRCGARILMCIADATAAWPPLLPELHRRHPPSTVAWAHARYGRYLALNGDGPGAAQQYLLAIERASVAKMFDEAADWLYALRTVRHWYDDDFNADEQHPLAQALRPHAKPSQLPGSPHTGELALHAMLDDDKRNEAFQRLLRWRWQTVVRAQLAEELEAVEALGRLYERLGETRSAITCFIRAARDKRAAAAARALPDDPPDLTPDLLTPVEVCRAAAYAAAAAAADLIPDEAARDWAESALAEVSRRDHERAAGPSARLKALGALGALGDSLTEQQVTRLIDIVEPLIGRPAGQYKFTDEAVTRILISLARRHRDAVPLLIRALLADQPMAEIVLNEAIDIIAANRDVAEALLAPAAETNEDACLAIILAGLNPEPTKALAQLRIDRALTPREHQPGTISLYAGSRHNAILASVLDNETRERLAQNMLDQALDRQEATMSRIDSLNGLSALAEYLAESARRTLFPAVIEMARGEHDGGPADDVLHQAADFSGTAATGQRRSTLSDVAVLCAARLSVNVDQHRDVENIAVGLLQTAEEATRWRIVHALVLVPTDVNSLNLHHCAVHPVAAMRALAAVRWAQDPATLPQRLALRLAQDDDHRVRRSLARGLLEHPHGAATESIAAEIIEILAADPRRSIRRLRVDTNVGGNPAATAS
jgi:hypothetical protein